MAHPKLLAISGSLRTESINTKLMHEAIRLFGAADVTIGNLRLPLYDGDLEAAEGIPEDVQTLADQIGRSDGVILACPEYNQGIPGVVKNALDWISRVDGNPWHNKPVAIIHATAGRTGGARANYALRLALAPFSTQLLQGPEILIAGATSEFGDDGKITNTRYLDALEELTQKLGKLMHSDIDKKNM